MEVNPFAVPEVSSSFLLRRRSRDKIRSNASRPGRVATKMASATAIAPKAMNADGPSALELVPATLPRSRKIATKAMAQPTATTDVRGDRLGEERDGRSGELASAFPRRLWQDLRRA